MFVRCPRGLHPWRLAGADMKVRVLGCSGAIAKDCRTTSFLIDEDVLVDAGTGVGDLDAGRDEAASTMSC